MYSTKNGALVWRHQYDKKRDEEEGARAATSFEGQESLTQQQFTKDADVNEIVRRFGLDETAVPPEVFDPRYYGDTTGLPDLRTILEIDRDAEAKFLALPAKLRERFQNNPAKFHAWVSDPENLEESCRLGLLKKPPAPEPTPTPPAPSSVPPAVS